MYYRRWRSGKAHLVYRYRDLSGDHSGFLLAFSENVSPAVLNSEAMSPKRTRAGKLTNLRPTVLKPSSARDYYRLAERSGNDRHLLFIRGDRSSGFRDALDYDPSDTAPARGLRRSGKELQTRYELGDIRGSLAANGASQPNDYAHNRLPCGSADSGKQGPERLAAQAIPRTFSASLTVGIIHPSFVAVNCGAITGSRCWKRNCLEVYEGARLPVHDEAGRGLLKSLRRHAVSG